MIVVYPNQSSILSPNFTHHFLTLVLSRPIAATRGRDYYEGKQADGREGNDRANQAPDALTIHRGSVGKFGARFRDPSPGKLRTSRPMMIERVGLLRHARRGGGGRERNQT